MEKMKLGQDKKIFFLIVFLISVYFMRLEAYLLLLLFGIVVLISIQKDKGLYRSKELLVLLVTYFVFFVSINTHEDAFSSYNIIRILLGPCFMYFCGIMVCENEKDLFLLIGCIATGNFLYGTLNLLSSNSLSWSSRVIADFWSKGYHAATLQASFFVAIIGCIPYLLIQKNLVPKILAVFIAGMSAYNALLTSTRTTLALIVITVLFGVLFRAFMIDDRNKRIKTILECVLTFSVLAIVLIILFQRDYYGIKSYYEASNLSARLDYETNVMGFSGFSRFSQWSRAIAMIFDNPFGLGINSGIFAHNFWLDTGIRAGVFSMVLIIAYTIMILASLKNFFQCKTVSLNCRVLILTVYFVCFVEFMLEPVFEGVPFFVLTFFLINGAVKGVHLYAQSI